MRLELPIRWTEENPVNEMLDNKEKEYTYGKLSIDSEDIHVYYDIDDNNTAIRDKFNSSYIVNIPFENFKQIYTEVSGKAIMTLKQVSNKKKNNSDDLDLLK